MELTAILVGLGVALALGTWAWFAKAPASRAARISVVLVVALAAGLLTRYGTSWLNDDPDGSKMYARHVAIVAELKKTPLLRLVLEDVPAFEGLMMSALYEDEVYPVKEGPTRALALVTTMRRDHVLPALRAADDASVMKGIAARAALIHHLLGRDLSLCREFTLVGLQRLDKLDTEGQRLFQATLSALEDAYKNGRDAKLVAKPMPDPQELRATLTAAGFDDADIEALGRLATMQDNDVCMLADRLNAAPAKLPADKGPRLARHLLTVN